MFSNLFSNRKRIALISVALLGILLASGALASAVAVGPSSSIDYTLGQFPFSFPQAAPSFEGPVGTNHYGAFLSGPFPGAFVDPSTTPGGPKNFGSLSNFTIPSPSPKQAISQNPSDDPPKVSCSNCYSISLAAPHVTTNAFALNAVENFQAFNYTVEPPDQALCANNHYVVESVNIGIVQVYSASTLKPVSGIATLDGIMGLRNLPSFGAGGWSSSGDVSCLFDPSNGGHWFIIEIVSTSPEAPASPTSGPGPFQGCFVALTDGCREGIAVSATSDPTGAYYVYFLDPNLVNNDPGSAVTPTCFPTATTPICFGSVLLNDFAKIGTSQNAFMMFYDEFDLFGPFNGAQEFAFSKTALETGIPAGSVNVAYENMGFAPSLYPIPADGAFQPFPINFPAWYEVIPAQTPDASQFNNSNGGTGFMAASLDFFGAGDNRVAAFSWLGLCVLDSTCSSSSTTVTFGGTLFTLPLLTYRDEGVACLAEFGGICGLAAQRAGPIPLGDNCGLFGLTATVSCPESGLASNGDGATQASYANGHLWIGISTLVTQTFGRSSEIHVGAAFWEIGSSSVTSAGFVTAAHEDLLYPTIAATDGGSVLMSFTLAGPDYYPSAAYTILGDGSRSNVIQVTATGKSPQDGFSEYQGFPGVTRPRWGDYGSAIFVPSSSGGRSAGNIYFAAEYIQVRSCSDSAFVSGATVFTNGDALTCGGTRTVAANWGSAISSVPIF